MFSSLSSNYNTIKNEIDDSLSISSNYNKIKTNLDNAVEKLPKTEVLKKTEKPKPKYLELTWRFYRNVSYIIVFISFGVLFHNFCGECGLRDAIP